MVGALHLRGWVPCNWGPAAWRGAGGAGLPGALELGSSSLELRGGWVSSQCDLPTVAVSDMLQCTTAPGLLVGPDRGPAGAVGAALAASWQPRLPAAQARDQRFPRVKSISPSCTLQQPHAQAHAPHARPPATAMAAASHHSCDSPLSGTALSVSGTALPALHARSSPCMTEQVPPRHWRKGEGGHA